MLIETEIIKNKLKEFYYVTGIPVAVVEYPDNFEVLYPIIENAPVIENYANYVNETLAKWNVGMKKPLVCSRLSSMFFCLIRYDKDIVVQLGPVASHEIDFQEYIKFMKQYFNDEEMLYHAKLLQGAPKIDINFFANAVILATDFICGKTIEFDDITFDWNQKGIRYNEYVSQTQSHSNINSKNMSFDNEIYHLIEEGNEKDLETVLKKYSPQTKSYFLENDISKIRSVFTSYGAIACHHAMMGGVKEEEVNNLFSAYICLLDQYNKPEYFWDGLPDLSRQLCHMVKQSKEQSYESQIVKRAIRYIEKNVFSKITMENLEQETGATRRTIYRHFMESKNMTPSEYIVARKLLEVEQMLLNTEMSVADISVLAGYSSQSHLNKAFETKYGLTPSQYRKEKAR